MFQMFQRCQKSLTRPWGTTSGCPVCGGLPAQGSPARRSGLTSFREYVLTKVNEKTCLNPFNITQRSLFVQIDKCPMQVRGQATLFGGPQKCLCGFHPSKVCISDFQVIIYFMSFHNHIFDPHTFKVLCCGIQQQSLKFCFLFIKLDKVILLFTSFQHLGLLISVYFKKKKKHNVRIFFCVPTVSI